MTRIRAITVLSLSLYTAGIAAQIQAVETLGGSWDGLFQIHETLSKNEERVLTGFRVAGTEGLFTSLHGVLESALDPERHPITATRKANLTIYTVKMKVESVNIKEDLAHLLPVENSEWLRGLQTSDGRTADYVFKPIEDAKYALHPNDTVIIEGNPAGSGYVQSKLGTVIGSSDYHLARYAQTEKLKKLSDRRSPDTILTIIPLQASVTHGESGSPVLTFDRRLVGVIDGGLTESQNWAVPVQKSTFDPGNPDFKKADNAQVRSLLRQVQSTEVGQLTSLDRTVDSACKSVLGDSGVRIGASESEVGDCIKQSLRANQAGEYQPLRYKSLSQFYLWIQFPDGNRPAIKKACFNIESVRPNLINSWRGTGCPHKGINSCGHYAGAQHNGNLGLVPWVGGEWDPELTVRLEVQIANRKFTIEDIHLKDIQFDSLPPAEDDDEC